MSKSLADQLLAAGLVDKKKIDRARKEKRQQHKQKGPSPAQLAQQEAARKRAEQAERDRQLNQQREEAARQKAVRAQVHQLLLQNRHPSNGDIRFNFRVGDSTRIKQLYVNAATRDQLSSGQLAICSDGQHFVVVSREVAGRIAERDSRAVVFLVDQRGPQTEDDDPYKDFPIPDDLDW